MAKSAKLKVILTTDIGLTPREIFFKNLRRYFSKNGWLLLLILPGLIHILMIQYAPMFGIIIAFKNYRNADGIFGSKWVGLDNFKFLVASGTAWHITYNTVLMNSLFILTGTAAALILALLLNEIYASKLAQVYQFTLFIPFFIGSVIVGYIAYAILSNNGFIDYLLKTHGQQIISFYMNPEDWRVILVIANLWVGIGFGTIIYLSGIIAINPEFFEAAQLDGANKLQQIWGITLPLVRYLVVIQVLLAIGRIFTANFGLFYFVPQVWKNGGLLSTVDVIDTFVYRALYGGSLTGATGIVSLGMAAAAGFYQSVVGLALIVGANMLVRKISPEHALF
jgi:putative aldouronate transport system permease protein